VFLSSPKSRILDRQFFSTRSFFDNFPGAQNFWGGSKCLFCFWPAATMPERSSEQSASLCGHDDLLPPPRCTEDFQWQIVTSKRSVVRPRVRSNRSHYVFALFFYFKFIIFFTETRQPTNTKIGGKTMLTCKKLRLIFSEIRWSVVEKGVFCHIYNRRLDDSAAVD